MDQLLRQALYYLDALWRRRWLAVGMSTVVALLGWTYVAFLPNVFQSSAKIYVDVGSVLRPLLSGVAVQGDIQGQVDMMRRTLLTRPNLEELARMTDLDLTAQTPSSMESLLERLKNNIEVRGDRNNLFEISYTNSDPNLAQNVVRALTTIFVENNLGENRVDIDNAQEFLRKQIADYQAQLETIERREAEFQQRNMNLLRGESSFVEGIRNAEAAVSGLKVEMQDALTRKAILEEALKETPPTVIGDGYASGPPSDIDVRIMQLYSEIDDLTARYTEQHPDVVVLKRRLERLLEEKNQGFGGGPARSDGDAAPVPNPMYSQLRMELLDEVTTIETLRGKIDRAEQSLETLRSKAHMVPQLEAERKQLGRDYEIIRSKYEALLQRRESARISAASEAEGNKLAFRMIEPANLPVLPSGPNRPLLLAVVFVVSLGAGAGLAWLIAMARVTYGSVDHLRKDFGVRVIGALTAMPKPGERKRRNFELVGLAGALGALTTIFLGLLYVESRIGLGQLTASLAR